VSGECADVVARHRIQVSEEWRGGDVAWCCRVCRIEVESERASWRLFAADGLAQRTGRLTAYGRTLQVQVHFTACRLRTAETGLATPNTRQDLAVHMGSQAQLRGRRDDGTPG
jgi:hypothetical protein